MKHWIVLSLVVCLLPSAGWAQDLYKVTLHSHDDARQLESLTSKPILRDGNTYLLLGDKLTARRMERRGLDYTLLAHGIQRDRLALDWRNDDQNLAYHRLVYENGGLRVLHIDPAAPQPAGNTPDWIPLREQPVRISYHDPRAIGHFALPSALFLDSLIAKVSQDSVQAYLQQLESYGGRVAGTANVRSARDWIQSKFTAFGYDSVYLDPFYAYIDGIWRENYNVIAVKPGTVYPNVSIVVGAHHDGVWGSPAVDDNGTGTVGVLEIARALVDVETDVTFIFATFDAEEYGLYGSTHYASEAANRGDQIIVMLNMDMIGHKTNTNRANLYHGANTSFMNLWMSVGGPLVGITGQDAGSSGRSDHFPFLQEGYAAVFVQEGIFSTVYHSSQDNLSNVNVEYVTRMIKATLATGYAASQANDFDGDGAVNSVDNCKWIANVSQSDLDGDHLGDPCDNCPQAYNPQQFDSDSDRLGDACDPCAYDAKNDEDSDGHCADLDNCPIDYNPGQEDFDHNSVGDACQVTPALYSYGSGAQYDSVGIAVSTAGDFNNDGFDDYLVGASKAGPGDIGETYLFSGQTGERLVTFRGEATNDRFGKAVDGLGDLNGDGFDDVIVGAPANATTNVYGGRAYVFFGSAGPFPSVVYAINADAILESNILGDLFAMAVCGLGDVTGDSVPDIAVGATQLLTGGPGAVYLFSGSDFAPLYSLTGDHSDDWFGHSIAATGDYDSDGIPDFLVGEPNNDSVMYDAGKVFLCSGADGSTIHAMYGDSLQDYLGWSVAQLGDLNGDSIPELAAGAPLASAAGYLAGAVRIYSGADLSLWRELYTFNEGDELGRALSATDDVDGDGVNDLVAGAWQSRNQGRGKTILYSGQSGAVIHTYLGEEFNSGFGGSICALPDLNNDGAADLIVGAPLMKVSNVIVGKVYAYLLGDPDSDGFLAGQDNCPTEYNPDQSDYDSDAYGDVCDPCPAIATDGTPVVGGDANNDGSVSTADIIYLVDYIFRNGPAPSRGALIGDPNCDRKVTATDLIYLANYVLRGGAVPCDVCAL